MTSEQKTEALKIARLVDHSGRPRYCFRYIAALYGVRESTLYVILAKMGLGPRHRYPERRVFNV